MCVWHEQLSMSQKHETTPLNSQASEMAGVCTVLHTVTDPLSLSLGLDIMEEVLGSGDRRRYARVMAAEGGLAALVRALVH